MRARASENSYSPISRLPLIIRDLGVELQIANFSWENSRVSYNDSNKLTSLIIDKIKKRLKI